MNVFFFKIIFFCYFSCVGTNQTQESNPGVGDRTGPPIFI